MVELADGICLENSDFIGSQGPFWWILQMSMALGGFMSPAKVNK